MSIIVHKGEVVSFTHPALGFSIYHVSGHLPFKYYDKNTLEAFTSFTINEGE